MKFVAENAAFAKALGFAKGTVRPSTIPILAHVAVSAAGEQVSIRANNLEREVEVSFPADVIEPGTAALPGDILTAIVSRLPKGDECSITLKDNVAALVSGKSRYDLRSLPTEEFPKEREVPEGACSFSLPGVVLREALRLSHYPADESNPRFYCRGVHMHNHQNKLAFTANDHHRLALYEVDLPAGCHDLSPVTIPVSCVKTILDLIAEAETVDVSASHEVFEVRVGLARVTTALIDCQYPDYRIVIPRSVDAAAIVRPYALAEALSRATAVFMGKPEASKKRPVVKLAASDGALTLHAGAPGSERGKESVDAELSDPEMEFAVTADYLAEMLKLWPEDTALQVQSPSGKYGALFHSEAHPNTLHVIMPNAL